MLERKQILNRFSQFFSKKTHNWEGGWGTLVLHQLSAGFPVCTEAKSLHLQQGSEFPGEGAELMLEDEVSDTFTSS